MMTASAAWTMPLLAEWDLRLVTAGSLLAGALLLGAVIIALFNRWRRQEDRPLTPTAQLAQFQSLYEAGQLSREEFERLREHLGGVVNAGRRSQPIARTEGASSASSGPKKEQPRNEEPPGFPPGAPTAPE